MRACVLAIFCVLAAACGERAHVEIPDQSIRPARVFAVTSSGGSVTHEFVGRVEAAQTVDVSFEVSGPLASLPVLEGQTVGEGALVAALDPTDFRLALREAEVQLRLAQQDLERKRALQRERQISESVVDEARAQYDLRRVKVDQARENLADSRILAPFDAYVARRFVDNHANVRAGDRIARLNDLNELYVVASIPEHLLATVDNANVISMYARFAFVRDQRFELTYRENTGEADPVAQTYEVTFAMPRPEKWNILPGMTAVVDVVLAGEGAASGVVRVPTNAVVSDTEKRFFVWTYDPDTHLVARRPVRVGPPGGPGLTILDGLKGGELVVATGASALQEGMRIRVLGEPVTAL